MESGPDETKKPEISLCIFPHLSELVVVDARSDLPGRPRFEVLNVNDVFDDRFFGALEGEFASLLRREEMPFLKLLALPQEVEGFIRVHGLQAILAHLNLDIQDDGAKRNPGMAVLFLTGPFLALDEEGLRRALGKLFEEQLEGERLDACIDAIAGLAARERQAGGRSSPNEMSRMIMGDSSHYATLWQSGE